MKNFVRSVAAHSGLLILLTMMPLLGDVGATAMAGDPILLSPLDPGASAITRYYLPQSVAETATVTGPFLIAAQTSFAYGTIAGIDFATTASTTGQCDPNAQYDCSSELLIEQVPSSTPGLRSGTVTLSDGTTYEVIGVVRPVGVIVDQDSLYSYTLPGNDSDPWLVSLKNITATTLTIGKPAFIDANTSGAASAFSFDGGCGASLAAGASCTLGITFLPTVNVDVVGFVQIPTGAGPIDIPFRASSNPFSPIVKIDPQHLNFYVGSDGKSAVRTITLTNLSTQGPEFTSLVGASAGCNPTAAGSCLNIVSNDCAKVPAQGSCQLKVQYLVSLSSYVLSGSEDYLDLIVEPPNADAQSFTVDYSPYASPGPPGPSVIAISTPTLQFPAVVYGQASDPQSFTVTNVSSRTLTVAIPSIPDFITDSSCLQLLPGASCAVLVRYVPTSGNQTAEASLDATATDVADPTGLTPLQAQLFIHVTGFSISQASVASPVYAGVAPIAVDSSVSLKVTNTSDVPLIFGTISGNRNYYAGEAVTVDTTGCGASLAPGKSCALVVNGHDCIPGDGNPADGPCFLTIVSNAWSSPDVYPLEGNETIDSHSILTVDSGPVVFGHTPTGTVSASQVVHVTLTNANVSVSEAFNVLPIQDPDFKVDNQCPTVLVPQAATGGGFATSCQILVTFAPQSQGFHVGTLTYRSSLKGDSIVLAGTGSAAAVSVSPASLKFPSTAVGSSASSQMVTVKNPGASAISFTAITLTGGQADDYSLSTTCGASLAAGASCIITVSFKPVSAGTKLANLSIADGAGTSPQLVALSGVGSTSSKVPTVQLSASSLTFARLTAGSTSAAQTITVTNGGTAALSLSSITVTGPQADDYSFTKTCGSSVAASASCTLSITFSPVSAGTKIASLTLVDNAGASPQSIALSGTGAVASVAPELKLSATALMFTGQTPGTPSVAQTITLTNIGQAALSLASIILGGGQADDYAVAKTCGATLASGKSCYLSVTFDPVSAGNKYASITITDNAAGSPQSIALTGKGT